MRFTQKIIIIHIKSSLYIKIIRWLKFNIKELQFANGILGGNARLKMEHASHLKMNDEYCKLGKAVT